MNKAIFKSKSAPLIYLLPTIIILLLFLYYPLIQSFIISFYRSNLFLGTRKFIGLENFVNLFTGPLAPAYKQAFIQSMVFSFLVVSLGLSLGLFLAWNANKDIKGRRVYQILLLWPFALSPAVAGTIFLFLFNPEVGAINQILTSLFNIKPRWLDNPVLAVSVVISATVWKNLGYNVVFYLAALQNIPGSLIEAAELDGAGTLDKFRKIVFPLLGPTTFFLIFTNITYSFFDSFGLIDILTAGGPMGPYPLDKTGITTTLVYKLYQDGFGGSSNIGYAASQGVLLILLVAGITIFQFRTTGKKIFYGGAS